MCVSDGTNDPYFMCHPVHIANVCVHNDVTLWLDETSNGEIGWMLVSEHCVAFLCVCECNVVRALAHSYLEYRAVVAATTRRRDVSILRALSFITGVCVVWMYSFVRGCLFNNNNNNSILSVSL